MHRRKRESVNLIQSLLSLQFDCKSRYNLAFIGMSPTRLYGTPLLILACYNIELALGVGAKISALAKWQSGKPA